MKTLRPSEKGMALLVALFFASAAIILISGLTLRLINQRNQVSHYMAYKECFNGLAAAYDQSRLEIESGGDGMVGTGDWEPEGQVFVVPDFEETTLEPQTLAAMPQIEYFAVAQNWAADGIDNNGDGDVDGVDETGYFTIHSFARNAGKVRRVEAVLQGTDVNVWRNAIFSGAGASGGAIHGNVSIHGSVHILGDHIIEGGEAICVLDMMGASLVHNNYERGPGQTISQRFLDSVPPLPLTLVNGEESETLNATLRVKRGLVSINSAAEIGELDVPDNGIKETMDGVFVEDGWTGSRVEDDGGRGDPTRVYSDNGWDELYDLGERVHFPVFGDDWRWPGTMRCNEAPEGFAWTPGGYEVSPDGDNYGHAEFFEVLSDGAPHSGNVEFERGGDDVYINFTRPGDPDPANRVQTDPDHCVVGDDYLYFNGGTNVLEINGQIEIDGDLEFTGSPGQGSGTATYYTGRGAILVSGDVTLDGDLVPCNNGDPDDYVRSFPENNCLGLMAGNDMFVGDRVSQMDIMGAFYAQNRIVSAKQTRVMGTFVAEYFDMGNQVPDIYQVPALADNLPLGMVGNFPIMCLGQVSWRESGVGL